MAAHLPRLPVLLLVLLAAHVVSTSAHAEPPLPSPYNTSAHGEPPLPSTYNYDASMCLSKSFWCGGVEIRYPFYLANATADYSGSYYSCGYTDLSVSCELEVEGSPTTWTPTIRLGGDNYTVKNILYDYHTILLTDNDVLGGGGCPVVRHNVSFDETWLHNGSAFDNLTFFFGCHWGPRDTLPEFAGNNISCAGFSTPTISGGGSFVFKTEDLDEQEEQELASHCDDVFSVPVGSDALRATDTFSLPRGGYGELLRQGFKLEWNRTSEDQCGQCEGSGSGGRCAYNQKREFLGCLCSGGKVGSPFCKPSTSRSKRNEGPIVGAVVAVAFLCLVILTCFLACRHGSLPFKSKNKPGTRIESFLQKNESSIHPKRYTYADVKRMTKSFAVKLGQGGFGAVYKGSLHGRQVAVKMLKDTQGDGEEFMNEVASISRTSHVNVVTLLGFCLQGSKRALIYEYMPNGSLERYAFTGDMNSENLLTWERLFDIAIGTARGLEYLHRGCNTRIVHFDIKPHNILLDQDFCPKISDFGLAKLCLNKESAISIAGARGTIGYIAPEVYSKQFGIISSKSDVYSYGMMVLEMVGARDRNTSADSDHSSQYFPQWLYEHLDDYCVGASEINGETTELVRKMIVVGLWCIQVIPTDRPTMTRVVEMLEGSTSNLELPPRVLLS
uniref:Wall-associated receptor-like kinase 1 n=1 Tax=Zea mays TaxID=4577 RepID=A0A894J6R3_MAIZE|nr:wall-associated receptor-like kinase 1 [Zea mays]